VVQDERSNAGVPGWKRYVNRLIARDFSAITRYCDRVIQWLPRDDDHGLLLQELDAKEKLRIAPGDQVPDLRGEEDRRTAVLLNGTFNHDYDIQGKLAELGTRLSRTSRVLLVLYNPYLRWLYTIANRLGIRQGELPTTFLTRVDLHSLAKISGYVVVRERTKVYCPFALLGLGTLANKLLPLIPLLRWFSLTYLAVLRPVRPSIPSGLSCVIPARNEKGNIENALRRFPDLGCETEIIFVEGHSSDGTWEEIQRVAKEYGSRFKIKTLQQTGVGKADAVRLGFAESTQPLLTILDADLTMPPEMLGRFYQAYCDGHGDFINGSRLVYPMEGEAMRFLNRLGNSFFAKALSSVLGTRLGDSLCGTKLLARHDYDRMIAWRGDFGDFDPFGDFELLFPAAVLGLGLEDVPVRYRARTYGSTNISRFRHGLQLLKMTLIGLFRIKLGPGI
jgi:glycosyl transferase family 2